MQALIVTIVLSLLMAVGLNAQTHYEEKMTTAFELWQDQKPEDAANLFERIAIGEEEKWLPYYYAAQVKIVESFPKSNRVKKEQLLKEAQSFLDKAIKRNGDEVELMILQAMLHTSRLTLDPSTYGMTLAPVISGIYAEASKKAPKNPRLVLSKAEWDMGSAAYFGESPTKYCPNLKAGLELFAEEDYTPTIAPSWGKDRLQFLLAQTCGSEN
ncbi:hypothetical protein [Salinimicrobium terrae]|uniref:hypothetical protein n=1 Tax=Salinimicrobium terrae TaxID=470866 RepID=UPI00049204C8|nr:hypothetical protein [Salinimicrobium terrae]